MNKDDIQIIRLGNERQPLVIIDNYASDPKRLVKDASCQSYQKGGRFYPGIRAPADFSYLNEHAGLIEKIFTDLFSCPNGIEIGESNYSLITTPESELAPIQSLPHFDGFDPGRFAILHYLCQANQGGTAFYRHKATGFETITEDRYSEYEAVLQWEAKEDGAPQGYFRGSERFEEIYQIEPRFNRLVIYRGILLHSGHMPVSPVLSDDPTLGRLTVNIFCQRAN